MKWPWAKVSNTEQLAERQLVQFTFGSPIEVIYTIHAAALGARMFLYGVVPDIVALTALHKAAQMIGNDRLKEMSNEWMDLVAVAMGLVDDRSD